MVNRHTRTYLRAWVRPRRMTASECNNSHSVPGGNWVACWEEYLASLSSFFAPASDRARSREASAIKPVCGDCV